MEDLFKEGVVTEIKQEVYGPTQLVNLATTITYNGGNFTQNKFTASTLNEDKTQEMASKLNVKITKGENQVILEYPGMGTLTIDILQKLYRVDGYAPKLTALIINGKDFFSEFVESSTGGDLKKRITRDNASIRITAAKSEAADDWEKLVLKYYGFTNEYAVERYRYFGRDLTEEAQQIIEVTRENDVITIDYSKGKSLTIDLNAKTYSRKGLDPISGLTIDEYDLLTELTEKPSITCTGTAEATINGETVEKKWVQLWAGSPRFSEETIVTGWSSQHNSTGSLSAMYWGSNWSRFKVGNDNDYTVSGGNPASNSKIKVEYCEVDGVMSYKISGVQEGYTEASIAIPATSAGIWSDTTNSAGLNKIIKFNYSESTGVSTSVEFIYSMYVNANVFLVRK